MSVSDTEAEAAADSLVGPVLSGPVQTCYCCPCGAVENVAEHFSLSPEAFEQLVDDVDEDMQRNWRRR